MSQSPIPILVNAQAGLLRKTAGHDELSDLCEKIGLHAEVVPTTSKEQMLEKLALYIQDSIPQVVVAGGDGTISLAVQKLVNSNTALGILPQGTHNNFATALRIPHDLPSALRAIKEGKISKVSVGKVNDTYFTEAAGVGLFADALSLYGAGSNKNFIRGCYTIFRLFFSLPRTQVTVEIDGKVIKERVLICSVANTYRLGAAIPLAPDAKLTDDHLDIVVIGNIRRRELWRYYREIKTQLHSNLEKIETYKAKTVRISSKIPMNVHCDDRVITTTPVTITIIPKGLSVITDIV